MVGLTITLPLALAAGSAAKPVPEPVAAPVPQDGMTHRRIDFSPENTAAERFCDYFADSVSMAGGLNGQCWMVGDNHGYADGSWPLGVVVTIWPMTFWRRNCVDGETRVSV
ncbi:uncharacterized protein BDV14DRAFT_194778 [Aspergillus stella-maris]|uniref:uncharacterized protein n=1 Tax=Aspergillus stella-maris TaxID=1810926 RepID=UPI003CCCD820